jgi:dihydrofolate reductase
VTRDQNYTHDGVTVVHSLNEALEKAANLNPTEIHIGGGAEIYKQVLPLVDRLHVTWFSDEKIGDTFFPEFESDFVVSKEHDIQTHEGLSYQWVDYVRK